MRAPRAAIYLRESGLRGAQLTGNSASPAAFVSLPSAEVGSDAGASRAVPAPAHPLPALPLGALAPGSAGAAFPPPAAPRSAPQPRGRPLPPRGCLRGGGGTIAPGPELSLPLPAQPPRTLPRSVLPTPQKFCVPLGSCPGCRKFWRSGRYFLALIVCAERKESYRIVGIVGTNRDWQKGEEGSISFVFKGIRLVDVSKNTEEERRIFHRTQLSEDKEVWGEKLREVGWWWWGGF